MGKFIKSGTKVSRSNYLYEKAHRECGKCATSLGDFDPHYNVREQMAYWEGYQNALIDGAKSRGVTTPNAL